MGLQPRTALRTLAVVVGLAALVILPTAVLLNLPRDDTPGTGRQPASPVAPPGRPEGEAQVPPLPADSDPYPECAACRTWLRENVGDPDSLEVLAWEERWVIPHQGIGSFPPGAVRVIARYRGKSQLGGKPVERRVFILAGSRVAETSTLSLR
jgi:hypothetical protein